MFDNFGFEILRNFMVLKSLIKRAIKSLLVTLIFRIPGYKKLEMFEKLSKTTVTLLIQLIISCRGSKKTRVECIKYIFT